MAANNGATKEKNIVFTLAARLFSKHSIILAVLFAVLVIYFVATFISLQSKVRAEEANVISLNEAYQQQIEENENLQEILESGDEEAYKEKIARENGYALPEERVYYDID